MLPPDWIEKYYQQKSKKPAQPKKPVCPLCGAEVDYVGLNKVDCSNPECQNYSALKRTFEIMDNDLIANEDTDTKEIDDAYF